MKKLIIIAGLLISLSATTRSELPDLNNKNDLRMLGSGRIIEKDNSIIISIKLSAVNSYWVVYEKDGSFHDQTMETIKRIEFKETPWGPIRIEFPGNAPKIIKYG